MLGDASVEEGGFFLLKKSAENLIGERNQFSSDCLSVFEYFDRIWRNAF